MGNKLTKEQALSERTKLCPIKAHVFLKSGPREKLSELVESEEWSEIFLTIHQSYIYSNALDSVKIDKDLLILSQDESKFEVKLISLSKDPPIIYIIRCKSIWQFKDFVLAIFFSKRPSWILFPLCQVCFLSFTIIRRDHHCRNCGKNICGSCSRFFKLEISGYLTKKRVCVQCFENVKHYTELVTEIQTSVFKSFLHKSLYYSDENDSILATLRNRN
ncbi:hypothetical protein SteCoe_7151 [Stentor coeruleus]|uniref:FYVE-type domain-containing protein n=1 Tax=Stentor coeruleus TaxID=5963 RepID=A0A1R2CN55_9CILI|nr:hypothetical protein SteCoe_7151 [Stentor coeruleus]